MKKLVYQYVIICILSLLLAQIGNAKVRQPQLLKDINDGFAYNQPGGDMGLPNLLTRVGNIFYYARNYGLWRSDGTEEGTYCVKSLPRDINKNEVLTPSIESIFPTDNLVFMLARNINIYELWRSDGTEAGTYKLKEFKNTVEGFNDAFVSMNRKTYFSAFNDDNIKQFDIWCTDGTIEGTKVIKSFNMEKASQNYTYTPMIAVDNTLFFFIYQNGPWQELWKSDGTEEGTFKLLDSCLIAAKPNDAKNKMVSYHGQLIFTGYEVKNGKNLGRELYRSDGTIEGTKLIKDIYPGIYSGVDSIQKVINDIIYFNGYTPENGLELWRTDGTENGTYILKDIMQGVTNSNASNLVDAGNGTFFFTCIYGLWKSDGTESGTLHVKNVYPNFGKNWCGFITNSIVIDGIYYFSAGYNESELYRSDGTEAGTYMIKDINPGYPCPAEGGNSGKNSSWPSDFINFKGILYFIAANDEYGWELWRSDGTSEGTYLFKDVYPGEKIYRNKETWSDWGFVLKGVPITLRLYSNENFFFFIGRDKEYGFELFSSDGTFENTKIVGDDISLTDHSIPNNHMNFQKFLSPKQCYVEMDEIIYFVACNNNYGLELYRSDGTESGTWMVKDIGSGQYDGIPPSVDIYVCNDLLYFTAYSRINRYFEYKDCDVIEYDLTLWRSDGTEDGTYEVVGDECPYGLLQPKNLVGMGGILYFWSAADYGDYYQLWRTDGTSEGTYKVNNRIYPTSVQDNLVVNNNKLFFFGYSENDDGSIINGELFCSDGTEDGTHLLKKINPNNPNGSADNFVLVRKLNDILFFSAWNDNYGTELWRTDGTEEGTYLLKDINPGVKSGGFDTCLNHVIGNCFYFVANNGINGSELWKSDGTGSGTFMVKDINTNTNPQLSSSIILGSYQYSGVINNKLFFLAREINDYGYKNAQLWCTDGSESGTKKISQRTSNSKYNWIEMKHDFDFINNKVYYYNITDDGTTELWVTDGTEDGNILLKKTCTSDMNQMSNQQMHLINGVLFFRVFESTFNYNYWKTCGDIESTESCNLVWPYSYDKQPSPYLYLSSNNIFYFRAYSQFAGWETFIYDSRMGLDLKDIETCYGNPVKLALPDAVEAGSGDYQVEWSPSDGLDDPFIINPTVINPTASTTYTVHIKDNITKEEVTGTVNLKVNPLPAINISVNPSPAVYPGGTENTIYLGYGPQSVTITATGGVKFNWSSEPAGFTSEQNQIVVSPLVSTNYMVTVTNEFGCASQKSLTINVIDARSGNNNDKISVCHKGNTLSIASSAVPAHLAHGDYIGQCTNIEKLAELDIEAEMNSFTDELSVRLKQNYPNPFAQLTEIQYFVSQREHATLLLTDINGRVVANLIDKYVSPGWSTLIVNGSGLTAGTYILRLESMGKAAMMKIVKMD